MSTVTKTFKSGNSVAVRLPKEIGLEVDKEMLVERAGELVIMRPKPKITPAEFVAALRKIGTPPGPKPRRQKIIFPKRPGL